MFLSKYIIPQAKPFRQDLFREIRECVSCREVAEHYGFHPNRAGFIHCPFHGEKTPSLKLYPQSWHCFGCGTGGDAADFVAKLFVIPPLEAAQKLDKDFNLGLNLDAPHSPTTAELKAAVERQEARDLLEASEEWRTQTVTRLNECCYIANFAREHKPPTEWTEAETTAIREYSRIEHVLDLLDSDDRRQESSQQQLNIFHSRKELDALCNSIL